MRFLRNPCIICADAVFGSLACVPRVYATRIDCETWPVSRRIVRPQSRRLLAALARDNE